NDVYDLRTPKMIGLMKIRVNSVSTKHNFAVQISEFVPKHSPVADHDVKLLQNFINNSEKIAVLTGAGISTESGIPDYRSEAVGLYARNNHRPVQYQDYLKSAAIRQRYWARNFIGWPKFSQSKPNSSHYAVQTLESMGKVSSVITQNVDSLHIKAGSKNVIELHGTAFKVVCLNCNATYDRYHIQEELSKMNPSFQEHTQMVRPDGDVEISQDKTKDFKPPFCEHCGGILKPDITFFGDNVPKSRVETVKKHVTTSDSVLVLGSSLTVFSGFRIILQAVEENKTIAIVNIGPTR
ncbi:NAD-dependent protein deacetylase Sirt4, partial [Asbolus verrucosus]